MPDFCIFVKMRNLRSRCCEQRCHRVNAGVGLRRRGAARVLHRLICVRFTATRFNQPDFEAPHSPGKHIRCYDFVICHTFRA